MSGGGLVALQPAGKPAAQLIVVTAVLVAPLIAEPG